MEMKTDLVLSPFGADAAAMLAAARAADGGFDGIYTYDHFSGMVARRPWSRDGFVVLGAIAAVTRRARLGLLVANMLNRHAAQLASAVNTLQALAPGRVMCGIGAGAAPGSQFAPEQELAGRALTGAASRRVRLAEEIAMLRTVWRDGVPLPAVVDGAAMPPIVVGGSSPAIITLAAQHADGVNIHRLPADVMAARVEHARTASQDRDFEISVHDTLDPDHPLGGDPAPLAALGVHRRTLAVTSPFPIDEIEEIAERLRRV